MFRKVVLTNGLTVLTEKMPHVRSIAVGVWIRRGSRHERKEESGLAHFLEHMLFKGTERRSQAEIAQEMDEIGGQTDAFTSQEYAGFHAKVLDEHVVRALDLLSDIVVAPRFDAEELERERRVILEEMKSVEDTPDDVVHDLFTEAFWPEHPLGRPVLGRTETVSGFSRSDLLRFFRKTYAPTNLIVAAAGNLEEGQILDLVEKRFSSLAASPDGILDQAPRVSATIQLCEKDLELAHVVVGSEALPQASPRRHAAYVLNAVLGGNLSSRLFQVIREEHALAYSVFSSLSAYRDVGQFSIYAGTEASNVPKILDLFLAELRRIKSTPVDDAELSRAKNHLRGSILMGLESTGARMSQLARQEMYFGRHMSPDEVLSGIDAVSAADVLELASEMFGRGPLAMTALGRLEHLRSIPESLVA
ncbi:MAG: M16 family metallopeptidase [Vicinamibacteria bacterium]